MTTAKNARCPRDSKLLEAYHFENEVIFSCPQCKGNLVPQKILNKMLEKMSEKMMETLSPDYPIEKIPDKGANVPCPFCSKKMENFGYMGTSVVRIDSCFECRALWLDTLELGAMSVLFARTKKREGEIREKERKNIEEQNRVFDAIFLSDMTIAAKENLFLAYDPILPRIGDEIEHFIGIPDPVFDHYKANQVVEKANRFLEQMELDKKLKPYLKKQEPPNPPGKEGSLPPKPS